MTVNVPDPKQGDDRIAQTVSELGRLDGGANLAGIIPKAIDLERCSRPERPRLTLRHSCQSSWSHALHARPAKGHEQQRQHCQRIQYLRRHWVPEECGVHCEKAPYHRRDQSGG